MRTVTLNYAREDSRSHMANILLILGGLLAMLAITTLHFISLQLELAETDMQALQQPHAISRGMPYPDKLNQEKIKEINAARTVMAELAMTWQPLFKALENLHVPAVSLTAIEPNPKQHKLRIAASSADIESMFAYIQSLRELPILKEVSLVTHEYSTDNQTMPISFVIEAIWVI